MADASVEPGAGPEDDLPECCRTGFLAHGTPSGTTTRIGNVDVYVARPPQPTNKAVVLFTDIFGWEFTNTRLLADAYAKEGGFNAYVPDFMDGGGMKWETLAPLAEKPKTTWDRVTQPFRAISSVGSAVGFIFTHGDARTLPMVSKFFVALKDPAGSDKIERIAGIGYCWGGRYVALAGIDGQVDVIAMAHPSLFEVPKHAELLRKPSLFLCAEGDYTFTDSMADKTKAILAKNNVPAEFHKYPGTRHGFAVRGDEDNAVHAKAKQDALLASIAFFKSNL